MTIENYKSQYQNYLNIEKNNLLTKSEQLKYECRDDEYKFVQVELNILDIFSKMFEISFNKAANAHNWQCVLKETYLSFFDKIPLAWHDNLEKCIEHGIDEEIMIETLKISKADAIKAAFTSMLEESV